MKYIVIEVQTGIDGTVGNLVYAYDAKDDAEEKFFDICRYAAKPPEGCTIMVHSVMIIDQHCNQLRRDSFVHPVPAPEE